MSVNKALVKRKIAMLNLTLLATLSAFSVNFNTGVHIGPPPAELYGSDKPLSEVKVGGFRGTIRYMTSEKKILIDWRLIDSATNKQVLAGDQEIHFSYWPTEVMVDGLEIVVAGKRSRGATCIEVITIGPPTVLFPVGSNSILGPAPILSIDEVYAEKTVSRDMVTHMLPQQGANGDGIFVQFWDSRDVYLLLKSTGTYTLVATPSTATAPAISQPLLDNKMREAFVWDHKTMGYIYGFHSSGFDPSLGVVLLVDDDATRDGVIDSVIHLTNQDWASMGMSDPNNYNSLN